MPKNPSSGSNRVNTLGLQGQVLGDMLDELDSMGDSEANKARRHTRLRFRRDTVHMKVRQAGGLERIIKVACRNLSSGGVCVLHNTFLHPGSPCAIVLKDLRVGQTVVYGDIVRCDHRHGVIHEVGIKFRQPINVRDFIEVNVLDDTFSYERFDAAELEGCVVHIDNSALDTKLVQHFLKDTRIRLRLAATGEEALEMIREGCDLVLLDLQFGEDVGEQLLEKIRGSGDLTPVIVVSGDDTPQTRRRIMEKGAHGFITKPFEQSRLLRSVAEFLITDRDQLNSITQAELMEESDGAMFGEEFTTELRSVASELDEGLNNRDAKRCQGACYRLVGAAPYSGHPTLAKAAQDAARVIEAVGIEQALADVQRVLNACRSILKG